MRFSTSNGSSILEISLNDYQNTPVAQWADRLNVLPILHSMDQEVCSLARLEVDIRHSQRLDLAFHFPHSLVHWLASVVVCVEPEKQTKPAKHGDNLLDAGCRLRISLAICAEEAADLFQRPGLLNVTE